MKTRTYLAIFILLVAVLVLFAGKKTSIEDTYGTWVNSDYNEKGQWEKIIINPDRTHAFYNKDTDPEPAYTGKYTAIDSWHDRKGNLWVKSTFVDDDTHDLAYVLEKISKDGLTMEWVWSMADYPAEMSPIAGTYAIYYRQ